MTTDQDAREFGALRRALELELISSLKPLHNRADTESHRETLLLGGEK